MQVVEGQLFLGGISSAELAERFGTPLFVMEKEVVRERASRLRAAFDHDRVRLFYAGKANPNLRIWQLIGAQGFGIDCCSAGEVYLALRAGFAPGRISFTGTGLAEEEMRYLASTGVLVNVDAISQVERFGRVAPGSRIGIRINPNIGTGSHLSCTTGGSHSKLGIPIDYALDARDAAVRAGATIHALHVHTGSGGLDAGVMLGTARTVFELAERFAETLDCIDLGGGLGIPHEPDERPFELERYARGVLELLEGWNDSHARPLEVFVEPGQYLTCEAGWMLTRVVIVKPTPEGRTFAILDSNFNHYLGAALYKSYHEFHATNRMGAERSRRYDLVGNLCNTGDTFASDRPMPELAEGDLLGMVNAGAYGLSRSSNYNSRPIPPEVLVSEGKATLIRRRQTYEDLLSCQM
ncbi:MAG: diaminopimelate decarboxylase [Candidatus Wallbacteria bacterium]|nr:diaminopimelate decarboxylase [Candidatus Wallbacteria bacterium]